MAEEFKYDSRTMSIVVSGEDADKFMKDKLCEQGLKGE